MSSKSRDNNQRGSILLNIIVAVILIAALLAVFYIVKQRGEQARKKQAEVTYQEQSKNTTSENTETEEAAPTDESKTDSSGNESTGAIVVNSDELPATGPEMAIFELIGVGFLTVATTGYVMSCRNPIRIGGVK